MSSAWWSALGHGGAQIGFADEGAGAFADDDSPVFDDGDGVTQPFCLVKVVGGVQSCHVQQVGRLQQGDQTSASFWVQTGSGFVEEQDSGTMH